MAKYFWGNDPLWFGWLPIGIIWGVVVNGTCLLIHFSDGWDASKFEKVDDLKPLAAATLFFCILHHVYALLPVACGLDPDCPKAASFIASRGIGNMMEWELLFIALVWLEGIFVDVQIATIFASSWVIFRFLYLFLYGWYAEFTFLVEMSTQPQYGILFALEADILGWVAGTPPLETVIKAGAGFGYLYLLAIHFAGMAVGLGIFNTTQKTYLTWRANAMKADADEETGGGVAMDEETTKKRDPETS